VEVSGGGLPGAQNGRGDIDSILNMVDELGRLYKERLKARDGEIAELKGIIGLRDSALKQREDEVVGLKATLADSSEKAHHMADDFIAGFPKHVLELLEGAYTLKCTKCGAEVKATVTDEQARQLLAGQPVQLLCSNPDCIDEFPWGTARHSIPLTFGPMLRLRLALLGPL
jgi:hypothetical protein